MKTLTVDIFDSASIAAALNELDVLKQKLEPWYLKESLTLPVATIGMKTARAAFYSAFAVPWYGDDDLVVSLMETPNGYCISAMGDQVSFIEFGAGVHQNHTPYPGEVPDWVVPWGEYGHKHGTQRQWSYENSWGVGRVTAGIPAAQGMYFALVNMQEELPKLFKGLFE